MTNETPSNNCEICKLPIGARVNSKKKVIFNDAGKFTIHLCVSAFFV